MNTKKKIIKDPQWNISYSIHVDFKVYKTKNKTFLWKLCDNTQNFENLKLPNLCDYSLPLKGLTIGPENISNKIYINQTIILL